MLLVIVARGDQKTFPLFKYGKIHKQRSLNMKKWLDEEYEFEVEVIGFLRGDHTEHYCRNGEEIGDKYTCTYGCPVNAEGYGILSKVLYTSGLSLCSLST